MNSVTILIKLISQNYADLSEDELRALMPYTRDIVRVNLPEVLERVLPLLPHISRDLLIFSANHLRNEKIFARMCDRYESQQFVGTIDYQSLCLRALEGGGRLFRPIYRPNIEYMLEKISEVKKKRHLEELLRSKDPSSSSIQSHSVISYQFDLGFFSSVSIEKVNDFQHSLASVLELFKPESRGRLPFFSEPIRCFSFLKACDHSNNLSLKELVNCLYQMSTTMTNYPEVWTELVIQHGREITYLIPHVESIEQDKQQLFEYTNHLITEKNQALKLFESAQAENTEEIRNRFEEDVENYAKKVEAIAMRIVESQSKKGVSVSLAETIEALMDKKRSGWQSYLQRGLAMMRDKIEAIQDNAQDLRHLALDDWLILGAQACYSDRLNYECPSEKKLAITALKHRLKPEKIAKIQEIISDIFPSDIPKIQINGEAFGFGEYQIETLDKNDLDALFLGEYTGCCQSITAAGAYYVIQALRSNSDFLVLKKSGRIIAQTIMRTSEDGSILCFDSIESLKSFNSERVFTFFKAAAKALYDSGRYQLIVLGAGGGTAHLNLEFQAISSERLPGTLTKTADSSRLYILEGDPTLIKTVDDSEIEKMSKTEKMMYACTNGNIRILNELLLTQEICPDELNDALYTEQDGDDIPLLTLITHTKPDQTEIITFFCNYFRYSSSWSTPLMFKPKLFFLLENTNTEVFRKIVSSIGTQYILQEMDETFDKAIENRLGSEKIDALLELRDNTLETQRKVLDDMNYLSPDPPSP